MNSIMLIDEDRDLLKLLQAALNIAEFKVETLTNSLGATREISFRKPDLLLMEISLPGLSGPALVSILRKLFHAPVMPVIFHSALPEAELESFVTSCGVLGYIHKGVNIAQFVTEVKRYAAIAGENVFNQQVDFKKLRQQPRLKLNFPIVVVGCDMKGEEFQEETETEDISHSGACFTISRSVAINTVLRIVDRKREIGRSAMVCWARNYRGACRLGVKFYFDLEDPRTFS